MPDTNYSDAERRAYVTASPTAALLAHIADLEAYRDTLEADRDRLSDLVEELRAQLRDRND